VNPRLQLWLLQLPLWRWLARALARRVPPDAGFGRFRDDELLFPIGSTPMTDPNLEQKIARLMGALDVVFKSDWDYSREMFERDLKYAVGSGTFLQPEEGWERKNWGARNALLKAHRELLAELAQRGVAVERPVRDAYFVYDWPETDK
jgi:hypothetical protein